MSSPEDALMEELTRTTNQRAVHPQMLSGHIQGRFLGMLVRMLRPHRVLEIGTFTGYSALSMAAGMEAGAILDTIEADVSPRRLSVAKRQFLGQLAISAENNESYMLGAAKSYLVFGDVDGFGEAKEKIEALDGETLRTVAEEIFTGMSALIYK